MRRILAITAGLAAAGAMVGAIVAALVMAVLIAVSGGLPGEGLLTMFGSAVLFGGGLGAVLGPLAAWTLMRHVPIWRAIVETAAGTALGAVAGLVAGRLSTGGPPWMLIGALIGFVVAAVRLRVSQRAVANRPSS